MEEIKPLLTAMSNKLDNTLSEIANEMKQMQVDLAAIKANMASKQSLSDIELQLKDKLDLKVHELFKEKYLEHANLVTRLHTQFKVVWGVLIFIGMAISAALVSLVGL